MGINGGNVPKSPAERFRFGRIATRIWVAVVIPMAAALVMVAVLDMGYAEMAARTGRMERAAALLIKINAAIHELQKERGLSVALSNGGGEAVKARRRDQMALFDRSRDEMQAVPTDLPEDLSRQWQSALAGLDGIRELRAKVDSGGAEPPKVAAGYTQRIDALIGIEEAAVAMAARPEVARQMIALAQVSRAKEAVGRQRAIGAGAIAAGQVAPATQRQLMELAVGERERLDAYRAGSEEATRRLLDEALADARLEKFAAARDALINGDVAGLTPEAWFDLATIRIDRLHQVEDQLAAAIGAAARQANADAEGKLAVFTGGMAALLASVAVLVLVLVRGITVPVLHLTGTMRRLAAGDNRVEVTATERRDEIGEMARAVLVFQEQALVIERMTAEAEQQRQAAEEARRAALVHMAESIENRTGEVVERVAEESRRVNDTAGRMATSALRVEENASRVAAAAEQSLANAQAVAGAAEELSASIREISTQVARSKAIVAQAVDSAGSASETVTHLSAAMSAIDEVVRVIAEIASQTNLLALNATIEAARAGEAGRGFAVVANEVKNLANQTARQTQDITARIATLKEMAERVTAAIVGVVENIHGVEEIAGGVAAAVEEQDAATKEISRNVQQSALAAQEVSERIVSVASEAASTGKQAGTVEQLLGCMSEQVSELGTVLTKVVRTATPDVNRRANQRYVVEAKARVTCCHGEFEVGLADISAEGARVTGLPEVCANHDADLTLEGIKVPVTVLESAKGTWRVKVKTGEAEALARWIEAKGAAARAA